MYATTRDFVRALEQAGELVRVREPVSPVLEIAAVADRVSKSTAASVGSESSRQNDPRFHDRGGRALLFENVPGSDFPVLINAWGSYRRMEMALGCHESGHTPGGFDGLGAKIGALVKPEPPRSLGELWQKARQFLPLLRIPPRRRSGLGLCQEVVLTGERIDLRRLPIIRCWPHDGDFAALGYPAGVNDGIAGLSGGPEWEREFRGRYITLAGIHTIHADDRDDPRPASHNIGMYRVQLFGPRHLSMHWHMHHDGARHWRSWKKRGERMPVAIVLGGESVMPYAATAPLPPGISELLLAGFLNRGGIPMVRGRTVPLWVPASAEIVIEGYVSHEAGLIGWDPRDPAAGPLGPGAVFEGPFGDHTGFYSMPDRYPLLEVTAITHRRDAIYPTTIVGLPPQEDYYLGKATERVFLPLLKTIVHDVEDYDLPLFGTFHNCAVIRLKKAYPLQGRRMMHSVWGAGQMAWTKSIFVVDDDVNPHDTLEVLRIAGERCHPLRDVELVNGPLDILDHAAPRLGAGMKIGFDCTRKIAGEEVGGVPVAGAAAGAMSLPVDAGLEPVRASPGVRSAAIIAGAWLVVVIDKQRAGEGRAVLSAVLDLPAAPGLRPSPFVIVLDGNADPDLEAADLDRVFFHWLAHSDASRDMVRWVSRDELVHRLGFDATPKRAGDEANGQPVRAWPPILRMDPAVTERTRGVAADAAPRVG
jgi:4-hydroxy-3-polyprenylbenzoate decarboxylase